MEKAFLQAFETAFFKATKSAENIYANGEINWNWVDADCVMELMDLFVDFPSELYEELFNLYADTHEETV